jgi:hypothetical protein
MKTGFNLLLLLAASCLAQENVAPTNELAFGLGRIPALARNNSVSLDARSGLALQVSYGRRFLNRNKVALYGEINFIASPLRDVSTAITTATHDFASLYVTPGVQVKLRPASRISPYAVVGGGYADYEQSLTRIDGRPNRAPRELARGVFDFGAGVDVAIRRTPWRRSRLLHRLARLRCCVHFRRAAQYCHDGRLRPAVRRRVP